MKLTGAKGKGVANLGSRTLTCYNCGTHGTFVPSQAQAFETSQGNVIIGAMRCPNNDCKALLTAYVMDNLIVATYPPTQIPFTTDAIPDRIVATMTEAITCEAHGCYNASAIMVRKTLEVICDEFNAQGKNLYQRIEHLLANNTGLPNDLLSGFHEVRALGNDAAHLELKSFDQVGKEEATLGIKITLEILKAAYQLKLLVDELKSFKRK